MEIFLFCPRCAHVSESTSKILLERAGIVECPSCRHAFDGYAHYRFDVGYDLKQLNQNQFKLEENLSAEKEGLHASVSAASTKVIERSEPSLKPSAEQVLRRSPELGANLFETMFAAPPKVRSWWWCANILLGLSIFLMASPNTFRSIVGSSYPYMAWTTKLCDQLNCDIGATMRIEMLRLVGADLISRPDSGKGLYQFQATIQNVGQERLKLPSMELKLTGSDGDIVTRRVFYSYEYMVDSGKIDIGAREEMQLNMILRVDGAAPVAFDSYIFYSS